LRARSRTSPTSSRPEAERPNKPNQEKMQQLQ
jgi:hypothetical protein